MDGVVPWLSGSGSVPVIRLGPIGRAPALGAAAPTGGACSTVATPNEVAMANSAPSATVFRAADLMRPPIPPSLLWPSARLSVPPIGQVTQNSNHARALTPRSGRGAGSNDPGQPEGNGCHGSTLTQQVAGRGAPAIDLHNEDGGELMCNSTTWYWVGP